MISHDLLVMMRMVMLMIMKMRIIIILGLAAVTVMLAMLIGADDHNHDGGCEEVNEANGSDTQPYTLTNRRKILDNASIPCPLFRFRP